MLRKARGAVWPVSLGGANSSAVTQQVGHSVEGLCEVPKEKGYFEVGSRLRSDKVSWLSGRGHRSYKVSTSGQTGRHQVARY